MNDAIASPPRKRIGFLSFGHWQQAEGSQTPTARDAFVQTVELAVAAEELGIDGAYVRVHHFARQFSAPFPLLSAIGVADEPDRDRHRRDRHALREPALHGRGRRRSPTCSAAAGCSSASAAARPSPRYRGAEAFGYAPPEGKTDADYARTKTALFRAAIAGAGVVRADAGGRPSQAMLAIQPQSPGLARAHLVGLRHARDRGLGGRAGHEPA